jgi:hypothetical protein
MQEEQFSLSPLGETPSKSICLLLAVSNFDNNFITTLRVLRKVGNTPDKLPLGKS